MPNAFIELSRRLTLARRRSRKLRHMVPFRVVHWVNKSRSYLSAYRFLFTRVAHRTLARNVYHCCTVKTGSQYVQSLITDLAAYRYSGLEHYYYLSRMYGGRDPRPRMTERHFSEPFPERTLVSPMYVAYSCFKAMPKAEPYRAFFVMRDPRDTVVSWYFSSRYSHIVMGEDIARIRRDLERLSVPDGLSYSIDWLADYGLFESLESWAGAPAEDPSVALFRFEDLTAKDSKFDTTRRLFDHLDFQIPDDELRALLDAYSFEKASGGRRQGKENVRSHIRKGARGDWQNHFDDQVLARFEHHAAGLPELLGY